MVSVYRINRLKQVFDFRLTILQNWTKRIEYGISNCAEKKVKKRPYSILIQKSKGSRAFDEQKLKNIAIDHQFFPSLLTTRGVQNF